MFIFFLLFLHLINIVSVNLENALITNFIILYKLIVVFLLLQEMYIKRLKEIKETLTNSNFFRTHEVIGSSLLFVHDRTHASIWLIDFAKTISLPSNTQISHRNEWQVGNHEDGYLTGIENLIEIFDELLLTMSIASVPSSPVSDISDDVINKCIENKMQIDDNIESPVPQLEQLSIDQMEHKCDE